MKRILLFILSGAILLTMCGCTTIKDSFVSLLEKEKEILEAVGKLSDKPDEEGKYEIIYETDGDFYWAVASETNDKVNYDLYIYSDKNDFPHFTTLLCSGMQLNKDNKFSPDWTGFGSCIVRAHIGTEEHPIEVNGTLNGWFAYMTAIKSLDLSYLDTKNATSCSKMFMGCDSLIALQFGNFNTSNVTDFSAMFKNCPSLGKLDLSGFDTSKAIDFSEMFKGSTIKELSISGFVICETADTTDMFADVSLTTVIADETLAHLLP